MKKCKTTLAILSLVLCLLMVLPSVVLALDAHDYMEVPAFSWPSPARGLPFKQ